MPQPTLASLQTITPGQAGWDSPLNANFDAIETHLLGQPLAVRFVTLGTLPNPGDFEYTLLFASDGVRGKLMWSNGAVWDYVLPLAAAATYGTVKKAAAVSSLVQAISNPPTQAEVTNIQTKVNDILASLRAADIMTT